MRLALIIPTVAVDSDFVQINQFIYTHAIKLDTYRTHVQMKRSSVSHEHSHLYALLEMQPTSRDNIQQGTHNNACVITPMRYQWHCFSHIDSFHILLLSLIFLQTINCTRVRVIDSEILIN